MVCDAKSISDQEKWSVKDAGKITAISFKEDVLSQEANARAALAKTKMGLAKDKVAAAQAAENAILVQIEAVRL